jgi:VCBS repeat-containing protein
VSFAVSASDTSLFAVQPAIDGTGTLTFTPAADANGTATISVSLSDDGGTADGGADTSAVQTFDLTITAINDPPVVDPVQLTINEDGSATGTLSVTDADGDTEFTYSVSSPPSDGTAEFADETSGFFTYTPIADFNGADQFTVTVTDLGGGGGSATVTITITAQNDTPVAADGSVSTPEDTPVAATLVALDVDGDELSFAIVGGPSNGSLSGTAPDLTYSPNADFTGDDSFSFQVSDGVLTSDPATFTISVTAVPDPPIAVPDSVTVDQNSGATAIDVIANDFDVDGDPVSLASVGSAPHGSLAINGSGLVTYTPDINYVGSDSFEYIINDGTGLSATGLVSVTVVDPVPDWGFVGLLTPWRPNYKVNAGSAIPLKWYYTVSPGSNQKIESSGALPVIRIKGPFVCNQGETADTLEVVNDPGSSDLRYITSSDEWQFNWDTEGLEAGCYNVRIVSQETSQVDGPFKIQLR